MNHPFLPRARHMHCGVPAVGLPRIEARDGVTPDEGPPRSRHLRATNSLLKRLRNLGCTEDEVDSAQLWSSPSVRPRSRRKPIRHTGQRRAHPMLPLSDTCGRFS